MNAAVQKQGLISVFLSPQKLLNSDIKQAQCLMHNQSPLTANAILPFCKNTVHCISIPKEEVISKMLHKIVLCCLHVSSLRYGSDKDSLQHGMSHMTVFITTTEADRCHLYLESTPSRRSRQGSQITITLCRDLMPLSNKDHYAGIKANHYEVCAHLVTNAVII